MVNQPLCKANVYLREDLNGKVKSGVASICGNLVKDNATGKILGQIKMEPISSDSVAETAKTVASSASTNNIMTIGKGFVIASVSVMVVGAGIFAGKKVYDWLKKRKKEKGQKELSNKVQRSENAIEVYFEKIDTRTLSLKDIKEMFDFIDKLAYGRDLKVELSDSDILVLRNVVAQYTVQLCKANNKELDEIDVHQLSVEQPRKLCCDQIKDCLKVQEKIFVAG